MSNMNGIYLHMDCLKFLVFCLFFYWLVCHIFYMIFVRVVLHLMFLFLSFTGDGKQRPIHHLGLSFWQWLKHFVIISAYTDSILTQRVLLATIYYITTTNQIWQNLKQLYITLIKNTDYCNHFIKRESLNCTSKRVHSAIWFQNNTFISNGRTNCFRYEAGMFSYKEKEFFQWY